MEVLKLLIGNNLDLNNAKLKIVHLYPDLPIDILPHLLYYHSFYHLYLSPYLSTSSISLSTCVHTHKGKEKYTLQPKVSRPLVTNLEM